VKQPRDIVALAALFGVIYFVQGIGEPTEGLIAQPVRATLKRWGQSTEEISAFAALLALPWMFKPIFGLLSDFVPIFGSRRRAYLLGTSAITVVGLFAAYALELPAGAGSALLLILLLPTIGVAFSDVVADALMIETGKPLGLTGRLQSVQWACMYGAGMINGPLGGWLSEGGRETTGYLICGGLTLVTLLCAALFVREPPVERPPLTFGQTLRTILRALASPSVLGAGSFLFLWSFNPFSSTVLYMHMTVNLGMSELSYGWTNFVMSGAAIGACLVYGVIAPRVRPRALVHASIALGVAATLLYWFLRDERSAMLVSAAVGFTYMLASLILLDVAARACDPATAAFVFALLMSLCNASLSLSTWIGGLWYDRLVASTNPTSAFDALVGIGAVFTALCWPLLWVMPRTFATLLGEVGPPPGPVTEALRAA
jgi:predicted MFS family arabinose efflux permease